MRQLLLPFTENQSLSPDGGPVEASLESYTLPLQRQLLSTASTAGPFQSKRLDLLRAYLVRHFPSFVLQERSQPAGGLQLTLYRIPDGTFYRINVAARFLDGDWLEDVERFLEYHGLRDKVAVSVLSPIVIDRDGIHLPVSPSPQVDGAEQMRTKLQRMVMSRLKEPTGPSSDPQAGAGAHRR